MSFLFPDRPKIFVLINQSKIVHQEWLSKSVKDPKGAKTELKWFYHFFTCERILREIAHYIYLYIETKETVINQGRQMQKSHHIVKLRFDRYLISFAAKRVKLN